MERTGKFVNKEMLRAAADSAGLVNPLAGWLAHIALDKYVDDASEQIAKSGSSEEVRKIAERQHLAIELMERRALAAQELALAQRMANATEVEVEECYDGSGDGALGLDAKTDGEALGATLGLRGSGRVMRKRIIRLKGGVPGEGSMEWVQRNLVDEDK
jgi:hypothetical protein